MKKVLAVILTAVLILTAMPTNLFGITATAATNEVYTITYHLDGGTNALKNPDVYTYEDTIILKDATKVGYDFVGWYLDEAKNQKITNVSKRTGNLNLYAKFVAKVYTASFNGNGTEEYGYKVTLRNDKTGEEKYVYLNSGDSFVPHEYWKPEAYGYVYAGWMYESEVLAGTIKINSDIELVPKWIENPNNYPVLGDTTNSVYSSLYFLGDEPTIDVKRFYTSYEYESYLYKYVLQKYVCSTGCNDNDKLHSYSTAKIEKYYTNSSTWSSIKYHSTGSLSTGESSGYSYKSDYDYFSAKAGDLMRAYVDVYTCGGHTYPINPLKSVWITVEPADRRTDFGKIEVDNTVEFDGKFNAPSAHKEGYEFLGWYDSFGNRITDTWRYTENQTFTANWQLKNYNISYELNGGVNNAENPVFYTIEDTITLKNPTKPGYTFKGWYFDADFTTQVASISKKTGNITLYANWEVNHYNLTVDANHGGFAPKVTFISDGVEIKSCYLYEQDTITAYRPADKEGYIFAGWYTDNNFTSLYKFSGTITDDITLYARWLNSEIKSINIESVDKFNVYVQGKTKQLYAFVPLVDGTITVASESNGLDMYGILYNEISNVLISADDISDTDLDFTYTYSVSAGKRYYIAVSGNTATTIGQAIINVDWVGDCTIKGTTYEKSQTVVVYGENFELPKKIIREGYMFLGWFDENDVQITEGVWGFVADKTLTAKWEETTYHTVTFVDSSGNVISSGRFYISQDIIAPAPPTKQPDETYIYHSRWDDNFTGVCTGDAVYSPVYDTEYIKYTVTFVDENGTELSKQTYHYGDVVAPPATPVKDFDDAYYYVFAGWDKPVVNCAGNTTYTATYNAIQLKKLSIISQPNKVRYKTGENIDLAGLVLQGMYDDETTVLINSADIHLDSVSFSHSGIHSIFITVAGKTVKVDFYVHDTETESVSIDSSLYPQSTHNYANNLDETKTFIYAGAKSITITFNSQTKVESNYDYIYVYDGAGNQIAKYTGTTAANKTLTIAGDTFNVRLTSDSTYSYYGYAFSSIEITLFGEIIHQPVIDSATVTCTQGGLTEGSHCGICGDILVAQEEIAPLGHNYKTVFEWSDDHKSCVATIICERDCEFCQVVNCVVTHSEPNQAQTIHTAMAEYNGITFTDVLTCDNALIVFNDWDGTKISSAYYHIGDAVSVPNTPVRAADNTYTYTFAGWDNDIVVNCNGDATYSATYTAEYIKYTILFKYQDGDKDCTLTRHLRWGDKVSPPDIIPNKPANYVYTYTFAGWDNEIVDCNGDAVYTATYTENYIDYTVIFKNWDGSVLSTNTYHYCDAVIAPSNPTKAADNTYTYTFAGWDKTVVNCAGDTIYTAIYTPNYIDYTVVFKNYNGTVLSSKTYHYGDTVTVPTTPTKSADGTFTYSFAGWDNEIIDCNGDAVYTATYTENYIDYTVVFKDWDGCILSINTYHYGDVVIAPDAPNKPADGIYAYIFAGWDNEIVDCNGDAVYTAVYKIDYLLGDINSSGPVPDLDDVVALAQVVAGWQGVTHNAAALDVNGDGNVTLDDVVLLAQYVAGWTVTIN